MVGLSELKLSSSTRAAFKISLNQPYGVSISSDIVGATFKLEILLMKTFYCEHTIPLYFEENSQCLLECPERYL